MNVNPLLTVVLTVLSGTAVYVSGQLFSRLVLESAVELRKLVSKVALALAYHINLPANTPGQETRDQTVAELPLLATQMVVQVDSILWYLVARHPCALPARCLYIGDGSSRELSGAAGTGMHAVLLRLPSEDQEDAHRIDAEEWSGQSIAALSEVVELVRTPVPM